MSTVYCPGPGTFEGFSTGCDIPNFTPMLDLVVPSLQYCPGPTLIEFLLSLNLELLGIEPP